MAKEISGYVEGTFEIGRLGDGEGQFGGWVQYFTASKDGETMYCCDPGRNRVHVFDLQSKKFRRTIPNVVNGDEYQARGIGVLRNGNICVNSIGLERESCVSIYTPQGEHVHHFAQGKIGYPSAMTVDDNDVIVVFNRRSSTVTRWDTNGVLINKFQPAVQGDILRMSSDSKGRIIIPEHLENRVSIFEPGGARIFTINPLPGCGYEFRYPAGVACDGVDNIYVCNLGHNRISKFSPLGVHVASTLTEQQHNIFNPHDLCLTATNKLLYSHVAASFVKVFCFGSSVR